MNQDQSLSDILRFSRNVAVTNWVRISLVTTGFTLISALHAFTATPIYRSEVLLAPVPDQQTHSLFPSALAGAFGGVAALAGLGGTQISGGKDEAIALLGSRALTEAFVRDLNLLPVLFPAAWDTESKSWKSSDAESNPTFEDAFEQFKRIRRIREDRKTGLVTLSIEWTDRQQAAQWADILVARVNQQMRARAISEAEKSLTYLQRELAKTGIVEVQQAIYRLIETQVKVIMLANTREEYSFRVIDPPVVPDSDRFVRPNRLKLIALGMLLGLMSGFGWSLLRSRANPLVR